MKLLKFRVKEYKSIIDSGECSIENDITIFAGKNEAGKTALLEALEDFSSDKKIRESAKPLFRNNKLPLITATFLISLDELKAALPDIDLSSIDKDIEVSFSKTYPENTYSISDDVYKLFGVNTSPIPEDKIQIILEKLDKIKTLLPETTLALIQFPEFDPDKIEEFSSTLKAFSLAIDGEPLDETIKAQTKDFILEIEKISSEVDATNSNAKKILTGLTKILPNFILFNSFDDEFPSEISVEDAKTNPLITDLNLISNLDLNTMVNGTPSELMKHLRLLNTRMKDQYKEYWTQDVTNLQVNYNNNQLNFFIEEDGEFYPPNVRSKGKQWHLAFYIRVTARSIEKKSNIILIDEPGLFLHATAQEDILNKLENSSKYAQIIFSTHSPYLLEQDKFARIRLVQRGVIPKIIEETQIDQKTTEKADLFDNLSKYYNAKKHSETHTNYYKIINKELNEDEQNSLRNLLIKLGYNIGTSVEEKLHKISDKETLTPIITAIGLELTSGIVSVDKEKNVICEGLSDVFYLQAFNKILGKTGVNFVFGGGSGNMPIVGTVLSGWGCKVLYLYDNDKGLKDGEKNLKNNWLLSVNRILSVVKIENGSIEDVFSKNDFKKLVLEDDKAVIAKSNSEYIKSENKDKVMLSKNFLQNFNTSTVLSDETKERITSLFGEIQKKFSEEF